MDTIQRAFLETPVGFVEINCTGKGIRSVEFIDFKVRVKQTPACLKECKNQLREYFEGKRKTFSVQFDLQGSPFQLKVWNELLKIPYGKTITYLELARRVGDVNALRAVGGANAMNPAAILVPCHRVIGMKGKLVGYAGGLWRKKWLLEHEEAIAQLDLFY